MFFVSVPVRVFVLFIGQYRYRCFLYRYRYVLFRSIPVRVFFISEPVQILLSGNDFFCGTGTEALCIGTGTESVFYRSVPVRAPANTGIGAISGCYWYQFVMFLMAVPVRTLLSVSVPGRIFIDRYRYKHSVHTGTGPSIQNQTVPRFQKRIQDIGFKINRIQNTMFRYRFNVSVPVLNYGTLWMV